MRRLSTIDIAICVLILALAAFTLVPAIARIQRTPAEAKCQANLQRIAEAINLYLADYQDRYPTNRPFIGTVMMPINSMVSLSPPDPIPPSTEPPRFVYGVNWVEALYPYTKARADRTGQNERSFWRCPKASNATLPTNGAGYPRVTCTFNLCLVEQPKIIVRNGRNLMMLREFGRLAISMLRPSNPSTMSPTGNSSYLPQYPFLTSRDPLLATVPASEYLLHGNGSHIAFADGHVKHFTIDYYPEQTAMSPSKCWDPATQQWYNYFWANPINEDQIRLNKSIAISP